MQGQKILGKRATASAKKKNGKNLQEIVRVLAHRKISLLLNTDGTSPWAVIYSEVIRTLIGLIYFNVIIYKLHSCYCCSINYCQLTHTHNRLTTFVRDNPGRPVPEETLTHSHPSWSSDILYHLPPFTTIHGILFVHFTCLTIFSDNLSPGPLWSSSWSCTLNFILNTFLHPVIITIIFSRHMPIPTQPVLLQNQRYVIYT